MIAEVDYDLHDWVILCIKSSCSLIYVYGCVFWFETSEISQFIHHKNYYVGNVNYNVDNFALCLNYNYARHPVIMQIALNMCKILDFGNGFGIDQKQVTLWIELGPAGVLLWHDVMFCNDIKTIAIYQIPWCELQGTH